MQTLYRGRKRMQTLYSDQAHTGLCPRFKKYLLGSTQTILNGGYQTTYIDDCIRTKPDRLHGSISLKDKNMSRKYKGLYVTYV